VSDQYPIALNDEQEGAVKDWAADDRLWTTQDTVEINLRTFARVVLKHSSERQAREQAEQERDRLRAALSASMQFLGPEVDRGPAVNGWQNTVDLCSAALSPQDGQR
jgi:hypothetical protein